MNHGKRVRVKPIHVQTGAENQGGQQGESQSSAPPLSAEVESYRSGHLPHLRPATAKLPPVKMGVGNDDGDNPHNPGGTGKP
jgi:hypothetical protein